MTISIVATVGSASSNSFVTEAEAISYMATRLNASAWTTLSGSTCIETEKAALIEATRDLSVRLWLGTRSDTVQALSWPRLFVPNPDVPFYGIYFYPSTAIPQRVKDATCELAFQFLKAGSSDLAEADPTIDIKRKKVDVLETEYVERGQRPKGLRRFPRVWNYVAPLLMDAGIGVALVRG